MTPARGARQAGSSLRRNRGSVLRVLVAKLAVVTAAAPEERLRVAFMALQGDVLVPMLLAEGMPTADLLDGAARAVEVLLAGALSKLHIAFAVNMAAVERPLASIALL